MNRHQMSENNFSLRGFVTDVFKVPFVRSEENSQKRRPTTSAGPSNKNRLVRQLETGRIRIRFQGVRFQTPNSMSFLCPHRVPGRELSEFLSAYSLCDKVNSPSFSQNSPSLPQNSVRISEFSSPKQYSRNSIPPVS